MEKEHCKNKKGALQIVMSILVAFSLFLVPLEVDAATSLVNAIIDPGVYSMPKIYGNLDNSVPFEFDLSRGYNFGDNHGISLNANNYYLIFLTGRPQAVDISYKHTPNSAKYDVTPYFTYGGQIYYGNSSNYNGVINGTDEYRLSCIFQGNLSGSSGIGLNIKGYINPYFSNGYVYADEYACNFIYKPECRLFRLAFNEDPTTQQLEMINNNLLRIWQDTDYLEEHLEAVNETIVSILNSTNSIDEKIEIMSELVNNNLLRIWQDVDYVEEHLESVLDYQEDILNSSLSIEDKIDNLTELLSVVKSGDNTKIQQFTSKGNSQSTQLDSLNQQTQPDKIDVNNASGVVDQNLDIDTDANYGVLLSTFTSNGKILTMLLAVSSIGLISYVLFGKR